MTVFLSEGETRIIYENGRHIRGAYYERVTLEKRGGSYFYSHTEMTDHMNAGGYTNLVPRSCIIEDKKNGSGVERELLLRYLDKY